MNRCELGVGPSTSDNKEGDRHRLDCYSNEILQNDKIMATYTSKSHNKDNYRMSYLLIFIFNGLM